MITPVPLTADCLLQAAQLQQVPPQILLGILKTEGGKVGSESPNRTKDGRVFSYDLGPMQVNDRVWVPVIAPMHFGGDESLARQALRDHGCYNIHIGAWIFRQKWEESGGDIVEAIGRYNSKTPVHKHRYQRRFAENFRALFGNLLKGN